MGSMSGREAVRYGRILLAARDSEAACATLGYNTRAVRVAVFAVSAGLAGVAGVFFTGMRVSISTADFNFFQSLPLLLFAVVGGVTTVTGVLLGGLAYGLMPVLLDQVPGQHVGLQTNDAQVFYASLGFEPQPEFWSLVVGAWLDNDANRSSTGG